MNEIDTSITINGINDKRLSKKNRALNLTILLKKLFHEEDIRLNKIREEKNG